MAYMAKSITYDEIMIITKTTPVSTTETAYVIDVDNPVYTVPTGRVAKVMYLSFEASGEYYDAGGILVSGNAPSIAPQTKINNSDNNDSGKWLTSINAVDVSTPKCIYLGAGDTLYVRYRCVFQSLATLAAGSTAKIYPSLYMCVIEEY